MLKLPEIVREVHRSAGTMRPDELPIVFIGADGERLRLRGSRQAMNGVNGVELRIELEREQ